MWMMRLVVATPAVPLSGQINKRCSGERPHSGSRVRGRGSVRLQTLSGMVNYRRVVCEAAALAALMVATLAAPAPAPGCDHAAHYDQRQNGSDNIRVHVDGVVVAVMPAESFAESLLTALPDFADFLDEEDFETHKPKPPQSEVPSPPPSNPAPSKPEEKPQASPDKEEVASVPAKPAEASNLDASSTAQPAKNQKKEQYLKQRKAQRVKNYLASFLMPLLRKNRHH